MTFPYKHLDFYRELPDRLCISLSGGRSSAYQAAHAIVANGGVRPGWVIVFANTGFELEVTLRFVRDFEEHFGIRVRMVEFDSSSDTKVREVNHNSASRNGEPLIDLFSTPLVRKDKSFGLRPLPNPAQRTCSANLKVKTCHRFLRRHLVWPNSYHTLVGYRADERSRYDRRMRQQMRFNRNSCPEGGWTLCPMLHAGVEGPDVLDFWDRMPFDLGGVGDARVEVESWETNCDFCFMKSTWKLKAMMVKHPERLPPWLALEAADRDRSNRFRKDRPSLAELWAEVQAGDMNAPPQDPRIECGSCTGESVWAEGLDEDDMALLG